jgi:two-component system sensor histidine kinase PrrB
VSRAPSLRTRVAVAAALGTTVVVLLVGALASVLLSRDQHDQLDRRLSTVAEVLDPGSSAPRGWAVTVRGPDGTVTGLRGPELPPAAAGYATVDVGSRTYRVLTTASGSAVLSVAAPTAATRAAVGQLRRVVLGVGAAAVALAGALGWLFAGRAVRPLHRLAAAARAVGDGGTGAPERLEAGGARETEALATEINHMLARLHEAQERTRAALETAREFAATAQHELRTPLTALRTDLEVLGLEPDEQERRQVVADLLRSQARVQDTLTALGQLASGELGGGSGRTDVDVTELLHRVAEQARRTAPGVAVDVLDGPPVLVPGWPAGLRLAVDNLVLNAVRHGPATRVLLAVTREGSRVSVTVDDDGAGVPVGEREAVFARFARAEGTTGPGSGLGLALVAQQAALHGGSARLEQGVWGGVRAVLEVAG